MSEHSFMSCSVMSDSDEEQRILEQRQRERYKKLEHAKAWPDYDLKNFSWEETDRVFREECIRQKERKRSKEHWQRFLRLIDQDEPCPFLVTELEPEDVVLRMPVGTWKNGFPFCFKSVAELKADLCYKCRRARKETKEFKAKLLTAECKASEAARQGEKNASRMIEREKKHLAILRERDEAKQRFEEVAWEFAHSEKRRQEIMEHHEGEVKREENGLMDRLEFLEEKNDELGVEICRNRDCIAELEERHARGPTIMKEQVKTLRKVCQNLKMQTKDKKGTIKELLGKIKEAGINMEDVTQRIAAKKKAVLEPEKAIEQKAGKQLETAKRNPLLWEGQIIVSEKEEFDKKTPSKNLENVETEMETEMETEVETDTGKKGCVELEKNGSENDCRETMEGVDKIGNEEGLEEEPLPYYIGSKFGQELGLGAARGKNIRVDYGLYYFHGENVPPFMQNKNKDKIWYVFTNSDGEEEIEIEAIKTTTTTAISKPPLKKKLKSKKNSVDGNNRHDGAIERSSPKPEKDQNSSGGGGKTMESSGMSFGECGPKLPSEGSSIKKSGLKNSGLRSEGCTMKISNVENFSPRSQDSSKETSVENSSPKSKNSGKKSSAENSSPRSEDRGKRSSPKQSAGRGKSANETPAWKPTSTAPKPKTATDQKKAKRRAKARPAPKYKKPFCPKKSTKPVTIPKEKLMWCEWRSKTRGAVFDEYRKDREDFEQYKYEQELMREHQARIQERKDRRAKQFKVSV
ncbi:hypothetical protein BSKO_09272 [Bryopsis sp. KO-2023]|nr:hypothetical protein BSKO_09272 [Bryopsis sp. KO-2023]